jgi:RimJ/RimL family protein N-acetyltransferase
MKYFSYFRKNPIIKNAKDKHRANNRITLHQLEPIKHALDFFRLYQEYIKDSDIEAIPFKEYYKRLCNGLLEGSVIAYAVLDRKTGQVIGFLVGDRIFPFLVSAHIVIDPAYRNFYNACHAAKIAINEVFQTNTKQIIIYVNENNKNVRLLLKKLGFCLWGKDETGMAYTLIKPNRKG